MPLNSLCCCFLCNPNSLWSLKAIAAQLLRKTLMGILGVCQAVCTAIFNDLNPYYDLYCDLYFTHLLMFFILIRLVEYEFCLSLSFSHQNSLETVHACIQLIVILMTSANNEHSTRTPGLVHNSIVACAHLSDQRRYILNTYYAFAFLCLKWTNHCVSRVQSVPSNSPSWIVSNKLASADLHQHLQLSYYSISTGSITSKFGARNARNVVHL